MKNQFSLSKMSAKQYTEMWIDEKRKVVNENAFAKMFCQVNNLQYNNGMFYSQFGKVTEDILSRWIWETISEAGIAQDVGRKVSKLLSAIKLCSTVPELVTDENVIPFRNGDYNVRERQFHEGKFSPSAYRLSVNYIRAPNPTPNFDKWLEDLFFDADKAVLQEYIGYCLIPTTRGQKALFLVGEGGAGKSAIGCILEEIFGTSMISVQNTQTFLEGKYSLAELEQKLLLYDDDLDERALSGTGLYKKLVTNSLKITAERKYGHPFTFRPYTRLISSCNQMLSSINDNSDAFYRRLLPLHIKPKAPGFIPDLQFYDKLRAEAESIARWALDGLHRLEDNGYIFSISERTKQYIESKQREADPIPLFLTDVFDFGDYDGVPTQEIVLAYHQWAMCNSYQDKRDADIRNYLQENAQKFGIMQSNHINGKRGFRGLAYRKEVEQ